MIASRGTGFQPVIFPDMGRMPMPLKSRPK